MPDIITLKTVLSAIFLFAGLFFCLTTTIGIIRFPDFYTRCHVSGNSETLALLLVSIGFIIQSGFSILSIKILILFLLICICNPIGTHILTRTAWQSGYPVWHKSDKKEAD